MEIRLLHTFLKTAVLNNFTKAAEELGYSQSNVSAQIKQLEEELGVPLFNRIGKTVSLTQYGQMMLPYAQKIVSDALVMEDLFKENRELGGTLRVGLVDSLFDAVAEYSLITFHKNCPGVKLEIIIETTSELCSLMSRGRLDMSCLTAFTMEQSDWNFLSVHRTFWNPVANSRHPLAGKKNISLDELSEWDFIQMEEKAPMARFVHRVFSEKNLKTKEFLRLSSTGMARRIVERENYVSLLPYYAVSDGIEQGSLVLLDVPELHLTETVDVMTHANQVITPQISAFAAVLETCLKEKLDTDLIKNND